MAIYLTSDWHFGHNKPFIYAARGFETIDQMNEALITNFNSVVADEDTVYVLGDLIMGSTDNIKYIQRLNGKLKIVLGNHDTNVRQELYKTLPNVEILGWASMLKYNHFNFYLSHFPAKTSNYDDGKEINQRTWNLCGHTHTTNSKIEIENEILASYHVEVDAHNNFPVLLDDIIQDLKSISLLDLTQ